MDHSPPSSPRSVSIFGSTGSIGRSTVDLIQRQKDRYQVNVLTAQSQWDVLVDQALHLRPKMVVIGDDNHYDALKKALAGTRIEVASGESGMKQAATWKSDVSVCAIIGAAGLTTAFHASKSGGILALANKEALVCAGDLIQDICRKNGTRIIPVDSEHSAIFQLFDFDRPESIEKIILTASGGPFRDMSIEDMQQVTPDQALQHPSWKMGKKITIDSATMMNKGLEIIEAECLFSFPEDKIDVIIHPQSIVHSCVAYRDGGVLAHMGIPDMRTPISYALSWPERIRTPVEALDLAKLGNLAFYPPDDQRFPALRIVRNALKRKGSDLIALNAANEIAVDAFLQGSIRFPAICTLVEDTVSRVPHGVPSSIEEVFALDRQSRDIALERLMHHG